MNAEFLKARWLEAKAARDETGVAKDIPMGDAPVDFHVLCEAADEDEQELRELKAIYFDQSEKNMKLLEEAIASSHGKNIQRLTHTLIGSSRCFGAVGIVHPLREMERLAEAGKLDGISSLLSIAKTEFDRLNNYLAAFPA